MGDEPPDWLSNPFTGTPFPNPGRQWWQIPDFDPAVGDIKVVWELSRMEWLFALAQQARGGDDRGVERLNSWLTDWCVHNPPFLGPNWKCGQEASIRTMHLAMTALILGQSRCPPVGLQELVRIHLQRIAPTVHYAMAQENNHVTSEAAALFIGGSWLAHLGCEEGAAWERTGRRLLERSAGHLIGDDGSFSQYSLNYHRVMLDTLCMTEVWRGHFGLESFSPVWYKRAQRAAQWLHAMVSRESGDGPNLGANDGARLLQLTDTGYRDFRPTVQLAMALFAQRRAYDEGAWDGQLHWLNIPLPDKKAELPATFVADTGGMAVLRQGRAMAMLRFPRFRFRPSQADILHLDLWIDGEAVLRDAGTYSYNTDDRWLHYFGGTHGHNTVQFDDRDQMPRLGRFLFGDWPDSLVAEALVDESGGPGFAAGYADRLGASHIRRIRVGGGRLRVEDEIGGFGRKAVLRWRLPAGEWRLDGQRLSNGSYTLTVGGTMPIVRHELVQGWESLHYMEKTPVPVLETEVLHAGLLTTEFTWVS
jgi:hypothetical protein